VIIHLPLVRDWKALTRWANVCRRTSNNCLVDNPRARMAYSGHRRHRFVRGLSRWVLLCEFGFDKCVLRKRLANDMKTKHRHHFAYCRVLGFYFVANQKTKMVFGWISVMIQVKRSTFPHKRLPISRKTEAVQHAVDGWNFSWWEFSPSLW